MRRVPNQKTEEFFSLNFQDLVFKKLQRAVLVKTDDLAVEDYHGTLISHRTTGRFKADSVSGAPVPCELNSPLTNGIIRKEKSILPPSDQPSFFRKHRISNMAR